MKPVKILDTIFGCKKESKWPAQSQVPNEVDLEADVPVDTEEIQMWPPEGLSDNYVPPLTNEYPNMDDLRPYVFSPRILIRLSSGDDNKFVGQHHDDQDNTDCSHQSNPESTIDKSNYRDTVNGVKLMMVPTIPLLQPIEHVYFRKLNPKKFDITEFDLDDAKKAGKCTVLLNTRGRLWLYVKEEYKKEWFRCRWSWELYDIHDKPQYLIKGWQFTWGMKSSVKAYMYLNGQKDQVKLIGNIRQDFCGPLYYMSLARKPPKYKAYGACYSPWTPYCWWCVKERFDIEEATLGTDIGIVTRRWGEEAEFKELENVLGLKFDITVSTRYKLLFISFLLLVWFQFHRRGGNGLPLFILLIIFITLVIGTLILIHFGIGIKFLHKIIFW